MADGLLPEGAKVRSSKYLNNLIEQDHRSVKQRVAVMLGFKPFRNAEITIAGIELMHRIRKGQFGLGDWVFTAELRPESGTRYSQCEGSAAHPTRMPAYCRFAPHPFCGALRSATIASSWIRSAERTSTLIVRLSLVNCISIVPRCL